MNNRIEVVEKAIIEEMGRLGMDRHDDMRNPITAMGKTKESRIKSKLLERKVVSRELPENEVYHLRNGLLMKGIVLDHVLDCSLLGRSKRSSMEQDVAPDSFASTIGEITMQKKRENLSSESHFENELGVDRLEISSGRELEREVYRRKFLERLLSHAQKLGSIQTKVENIKTKVDASKRSSKKSKNTTVEVVKTQLQEVEEAVVQLMVINDHLTKDSGGNRSSLDENVHLAQVEEMCGAVYEKKVREQARRESEKIRQLQFTVQNIEYTLTKMEDEKAKGKKHLSRAGMDVLPKDLIYNRKQSNGRKLKRGCLCGCSRISTKGD